MEPDFSTYSPPPAGCALEAQPLLDGGYIRTLVVKFLAR